ncbi:MAG TPA: EAL domain-containing protein [Gammaproteobacteria bacterium]|nr:EAL domain-containing protein [Gammaproteobacteria bacterium]
MDEKTTQLDVLDFSGNCITEELTEILISILETIIQLPWLSTGAGGIMLADDETRKLELVAQINFSDYIKTTCSCVDYGHCLCGRVAESVELLHASCVDERHETHYEGMCDHGHYVVPITLHDNLLGVMVLYVDVGHVYDPEEVHVLENFALIVAQIIYSAHIQQEKKLADLILSHSSSGVLITDRDSRIQWVNRAFERVSGYRLPEVIGKTPGILRSDYHGEGFYRTMWNDINTRGFWEGEIWNRRKNGEIYPEWLNVVALKDIHGNVLFYAGMFVDLSTVKAAEKKIERLAYYDSVTQLANASLLHEQLEEMLVRTRLDGGLVAVITLDLDHFHEINTSLGRRAGDAVLRETASRIQGLVEDAVVARMGADEFVIAWVIDEGSTPAQETMENQAEKLQIRLRDTFVFEQHELKLDGSIGLVFGEGENTDPETLLRRAGIALAYCKKHRRGSYRFFNEEIEQEVIYRRQLGDAISRAIERDELNLVYQPKVDREGKVFGAEVLLRWESAEYGQVPPDLFIGIAEERGAIIDIGSWVFEMVLGQMADWRASGVFSKELFPKLAINISPHQILLHNIAREFSGACKARGFDPSLVELEVTETSIMHSSDSVIGNLQALSQAGFKIAIDDFGTGHSSLARLSNFPVDVLKIDRSFIQNMSAGQSDIVLVKSIIDMAHTLGFEVVAEGVEENSQLVLLQALGCDVYQGYYFSRPLAVDEFVSCVKRSPFSMKGG